MRRTDANDPEQETNQEPNDTPCESRVTTRTHLLTSAGGQDRTNPLANDGVGLAAAVVDVSCDAVVVDVKDGEERDVGRDEEQAVAQRVLVDVDVQDAQEDERAQKAEARRHSRRGLLEAARMTDGHEESDDKPETENREQDVHANEGRATHGSERAPEGAAQVPGGRDDALPPAREPRDAALVDVDLERAHFAAGQDAREGVRGLVHEHCEQLHRLRDQVHAPQRNVEHHVHADRHEHARLLLVAAREGPHHVLLL